MNFVKIDKLCQFDNFIKIFKLHQASQTSSNLTKFYQTWWTSSSLISFIKLDQLHQPWSMFIKFGKFCQNWWTSSNLIHFDQLYHVRTLPASLMFAWIGGGTACDVFSVVRHSRMWCPHDIGRDSWVWGEQETLWSMNSPHEVGEEALSKRSSLTGGSGVARGWDGCCCCCCCCWILLLLKEYLLLSQVDHGGSLSLGTCAHFKHLYRESPSKTIRPQIAPFVVVGFS